MNDYIKKNYMRGKELYDYPYGSLSDKSENIFLLSEFMLNNGLSDKSDVRNLEIGESSVIAEDLSYFLSFPSVVLLDEQIEYIPYFPKDYCPDKSYVYGNIGLDKLLSIYKMYSSKNSKLQEEIKDNNSVLIDEYFKNIISAGRIHSKRELLAIFNSECRVFLGDVFDKSSCPNGLNDLNSKFGFNINGEMAESLVKYCGIPNLEYYEKQNLKNDMTIKLIVKK